ARVAPRCTAPTAYGAQYRPRLTRRGTAGSTFRSGDALPSRLENSNSPTAKRPHGRKSSFPCLLWGSIDSIDLLPFTKLSSRLESAVRLDGLVGNQHGASPRQAR